VETLIRNGRRRFLLAGLVLLGGWLAAGEARADKLVLKDGKIIFGNIINEKDSLIRYFDRFERPRKIVSARVDTIHYDSRSVRGLVKVAFRKGQPQDRGGYFRLRHSEELDLDVEYKTDSASELDLFFRNNVHVRVLPNTQFKVVKAPKSEKDPLAMQLFTGRVLVTSSQSQALARIITPWGIGVGRGACQLAVRASPADSSALALCLRGLVGFQESADSPGELVIEEGKAVSLYLQDGVLNRKEPDAAEVADIGIMAANVGHYRFSAVAYPKIGYLPKAITGLGFMVFFYGSAIGILNYVNHI
jgi:hypothetical protein